MKKGWQTKTLGEVCVFQRGLTYGKGDEVEFSENVVLRAMNIDLASHLLDFTELKYISDKVAVPESKKVKLGSLMICTASGSKSHLGKIAFIDEDYGYAFGGFMGMLTPSAELVSKYLFHLMTSGSYEDFIGALADGMNINNLKFDELKQFQVPFPPLPEQRRIVGILDEAFAGLATAKANAEKNLHNARALFESHLQSVFSQRGKGWVERSLGETCKMYQPKTIGTKDLVANGPYPVFGANGVIGRYDKFNHEEPQLLVTCRGATCGSVNVSAPKSWITGNAMVVRPLDQSLDLKFLEYAFRGGIDISKAITGAAQPQITRTNLSPLSFCFPKSVADQVKLAKQFESLTTETIRLAAIYQQKLAALEALKKSLLHQAFSGEL